MSDNTVTTNDLAGLNEKVENSGATAKGRLSAPEFNLLVNATIECQDFIERLVSYFVPISSDEYNKMSEEGTLEDRPYFVYESEEEGD